LTTTAPDVANIDALPRKSKQHRQRGGLQSATPDVAISTASVTSSVTSPAATVSAIERLDNLIKVFTYLLTAVNLNVKGNTFPTELWNIIWYME